ncbi:MAG: TM1266 family iron-only hydrogenase system putative regulator [Bacteroidales bacterium]
MEKRIGTISILVYDKTSVAEVNRLLSEYSDFILARYGLPLPDRHLNIISIIIETSTNNINALTGNLGRIRDVEVKTILSKHIENENRIKTQEFHR